MNTVSSRELNQRGCFLLSQGSVSEGLIEFKKALFVLKNEIDQAMDLLPSHSPPLSLYREHEATAGKIKDWSGWLIPAPKVSKQDHERFWIFSCPLAMPIVEQAAGNVMRSNSDVFTISFNVAVASHLLGVEQEFQGEYDKAIDAFLVAMKMYHLTLRLPSDTNFGVTSNLPSDELYAAIFNNLTHVHSMIGESIHSKAFAEQLLKHLFYLVDSGRVRSVQDIATHEVLFENVHCVLLSPSNSAAAA
jgi:tetratricopeptide (TPR) repeat protein